METTAQEDAQFLKWILSEAAKQYWVLDRGGKRMKLKEGWTKAQTEYDRISGSRFSAPSVHHDQRLPGTDGANGHQASEQ